MVGSSQFVAKPLTPRQKKSTYAVIVVLSLLGGVEYAVILPTLYLHLQETYHAPTYALGIVLSAFSFSGLFASPIMGRIYDTTRHSKILISVTCLFNIVGSLMYWMGLNVWFLTASRLVAGLGNGFFPIVLAEVTHSSSSKNRTSLVSAVMAARQLGLLIGPACTFFLRETNFYIGRFKVDVYSSPGLFMAVLWVIAFIIHIIFYHSMTSRLARPVTTGITAPPSPQQHSHSTKDSLLALVSDDYMTIFMLTVVALFNQTGVETLATPLCTDYLGWNEVDVSIMFFGAGVLILVSFALVHFFSKRFDDRSLVLFGLLCQIVSVAWLYWLTGLSQKPADYGKNTAILLTGITVNVFGLPFLFVCHVSLFSKLLHKDIQGTGHGVRRGIGGVASIMGPLWTSSLYHQPSIMVSVMLGINTVCLALLVLSYKRLRAPDHLTDDNDVSVVDETVATVNAVHAHEEINSDTGNGPTERSPLIA